MTCMRARAPRAVLDPRTPGEDSAPGKCSAPDTLAPPAGSRMRMGVDMRLMVAATGSARATAVRWLPFAASALMASPMVIAQRARTTARSRQPTEQRNIVGTLTVRPCVQDRPEEDCREEDCREEESPAHVRVSEFVGLAEAPRVRVNNL